MSLKRHFIDATVWPLLVLAVYKYMNMKIFNKVSVVLLAIACVVGVVGLVFAVTAVNLGTASNFAILAGSTITNTGSSVINGDLGLNPGTSVTGFPPGTLNGTQHAANATALQAQADLVTAYDNAAGQTPVDTIATELGGTTKTAGIYNSASGTFGITGTLTLNAQGDANAVFIFKTATTLITGGASDVLLVNGAQACNVFWQVGSSATLGTNSTFKGNILALTSATLTTGANVEGRVLARNGAVTLDTNTVTKATCVVPPVSAAAAEAAAAKLTGNSSSGYFAPLPLINVTKVPNPLSLPGGKGSVTYTYVATNIGPVAMVGTWVKDDKCAPVTFISGDSNNNTTLDINEAWTYRCTKMVSATETNTATAHGNSNGWDAYDSANATVVVGVSLPPPLIHLVKKPSAFILSAAGGPITYSYKVSNPGTAPLSNVSVVDDKCPGLPGRVAGHPGDLNKNNLLESNEIWSFTCETYLSKTTTNIGTAEGHANGLTALDFSPATVLVSAPGLPNTGIGPDEKSIPWNIFALATLAGAVMFLYATKSKQAIR